MTHQIHVVSYHEALAANRLLLGGKAANLTQLSRADQIVPPWYALTTWTFRKATMDLDPLPSSAPSHDQIKQWASARKQQILARDVPDQIAVAVKVAHDRLFESHTCVAVRSSAVDEDASGGSFAGLHDSLLFVRGEREVLSAVRTVWASAYNERAIAYRLERQLNISSIAIAVVIQQMVEATISGVMFTANPTTANPREIIISSLYGAGEGIVSAGLDADTFTINKTTGAIEAQVVSKPTQLLFDIKQKGSGLREVEVPVKAQQQPSLSPEQLAELTSCGTKIEQHFGTPQDIEFSFDADGQLYTLQSRPITTVDEYGPAAGNLIVWDNSNIIESYSGVTSPMTFSFIRRAYTIVYHCFAQVMGISPKVVRDNQRVFENMLGLIRGQVYYNLRNWYQLVRLFPGFNYNKAFMESMMGVKQGMEFDEPERCGFARRYFVEFPALVRLLLRTGRNFLRIRRMVGSFERHFASNYDRWTAMDFETMKPHELMSLYYEMEDKLLWNWKAPIINDFYVMIFYGTLKRLCATWCGDQSGALQNDLLCGEGGIESTEPTKMLLRLATLARGQPQLAQLIATQPHDQLAHQLAADRRFADFNKLFHEYLRKYGFRCMNELKLEEYSLRDRPEFVFRVLKNYLSVADDDTLDIDKMARKERLVRAHAEDQANAALAKGRTLVPRWTIFNWVLRNARLGVKNRENMRLARTKIYGLLRNLLRALGRRLQAEDVLEDAEDIFYLTLDEAWDFVKGTAVCTDLKGLVNVRRREFDQYRANESELDDHFDTYGMVYHRNRFRDVRTEVVAEENGSLRGIGCCPGTVSGPVKVIRSPGDDVSLSGEILVAGRTDPGWVPLYPSVSGILIERGSILSHSAIVAREMGIPTIVGIPGLLKSIKTGQTVEMNGSTGVVTVEE